MARLVGLALIITIAVPPVQAAERTVRVSEQTCARLVRHTPAANVEYRGGVDVHGDPVTPAEVGGGSTLDLPDTVAIPITVELFETDAVPERSSEDGADTNGQGGQTGNAGNERPTDRAGFSADAEVGTVKIDLETGRVTYNGRPVTTAAQRELARRCQKVTADK